ncbi:MAG: DinB family protein [Saprospiraceae bacterium]|nr:DinB family protein [Saprospiraceae bacterium]
MRTHILAELFERDLRQFAAEIELYPDEALLWKVQADISNSAGNLCLHLVGNLQHFIGAVLGGTGYVRDRPREFSDKQVPRAELLRQLEATIAVVNDALRRLPEAALLADYPLEKRGEIVPTDHMLLHLYGHLSYHLGQVNYHRRLVGQFKT